MQGKSIGHEIALIVLLRIAAALLLFALVAVVMPHTWMDAVHRWLGLGELPQMPIVGYLTRSLSLFYAFQGVLLLYLSFHVRAYLALIRFFTWMSVFFGLALYGIDYAAGLPVGWVVCEGTSVLVLCAVILWLIRRIEVRTSRSDAAGANL